MTEILIDNAITDTETARLAEPAFSGALSFMRTRYNKDVTGADVAILGLPFDGASSNRPGARFAPRSIREASASFDCEPQYPSMLDPFRTLNAIDFGDCFIDFSRQLEAQPQIYSTVLSLLKRCAQVISIGGDHSVTLPILQAYAELRGPVAIVQFDAHPDVWGDSPNRVSHGTWMRQAIKKQCVRKDNSIQVGIRTYVADDIGMEVILAYDAIDLSVVELADRIRSRVGTAPVYLTFDIDVLDPAYAPGTGTPVAGGFRTDHALRTLWELRDLDWCGMDLVEVCPPYDLGGTTALAGATVVQHYLQILAAKKSTFGHVTGQQFVGLD
ncbi:agmatinase [Phyllobacterium sp. LjRoot231]|uniref:agmatinase n=1 Tax=Phyllobacterium sp. LjRoot231 TaxID=3342289 RepID=UPI003ECCC4CA